ncbi:hypothetical protein GGH12_002047 [Coemansia sp. RSA 1822]|nr:hypothetical protein LPJ76_000935 [Coemansia sp. RSA 638]KAJ2544643.1 hypothetical protein GGF49_001129 [Coemansia sp. RSA 1853]KAJ2564290.1 hypothetical protein GGH12_002047 [Coemansia sp. RSA 1822]
MRRSATDREKRMSLGAFINDPQTASSPELPSGFMSSLLDFDGRPRSWSSNSSQKSRAGGPPISPLSAKGGPAGTTPPNFTRSLRTASIRSSARGAQSIDVVLDGAATPSQPQVATTFAHNSRRVEARGQIHSRELRPSSASSMQPLKRKQALSMMKPLATPSQDFDTGRNTDPDSAAASTTVTPRNSTRACSKSSSGSSIDEEQAPQPGAMSCSLPHDLAPLQASLTARRIQKSAHTEPATATDIVTATATNVATSTDITTVTATALSDSKPSRPSSSQSSSLWAAISRLSLGAPGNDSQSSLDSGAGTRKSAVDHLKEIERKQPAEHVDNSLVQDVQPAIGSLEQPHTDSPAPAGTANPAAATEEQAESVTVTDASAANQPPRSSTWLGWWSGTDKQPDTPTMASAGTVATVIPVITASSSSVETPDTATNRTAECPSHLAGSALAKNMLMPDFDIGSGEVPVDVLAGNRLMDRLSCGATSSETQDDEARASDKHARADADVDSDAPLRKRLRAIGQTVMDSAIDMAPGWARSMLQGQRVADTQGQQRNTEGSGGPEPTADQLKDLMDDSARRLGKIAVIGVHGWFPRRMLQMLAGEPTGKSEKFCLMMRDALKAYLLDSHGVSVADDDISLFPLIGEGQIQDRVELLLAQIIGGNDEPANSASESAPSTADPAQKPSEPASGAERQAELAAEALMPPRQQRAAVLRSADTVFVVTHSQGTPVSAMLIERLLEAGILDATRQRVGLLAMAGIGHGPLAHLRDNVVIKYIESNTARELFELMDPSSFQSQRFVAALSTILHAGVRVVCVGSWVDEVVPLHSAIVQGVSHPHVFRAVYVDAAHYADDFLTGLIVFALRLRNAGMYDHGLLVHLSGVVAGSLWGHWGHSTVYAEPAVYKLAVKWLLLSTATMPEPAHMSYRPFHAAEPLNPFYIPSIMRTLWDDPSIQACSSLRAELQRLVALFDKWTPETRAAKELRYRLEPVSCFQ